MEDGTLHYNLDSLIAGEEATKPPIQARGPEQRTLIDTRVTRSGTGISPAAMATTQGSDQEHGDSDGHNSPLFVSNSSTPASSTPVRISSDTARCKCGVVILVPPVERRWEYRVFQDEPRVSEIIEDYEDAEELQYLVAFEDGHEAKIPFARLINLVNGAAALELFNERSILQGQSDSETTTAMTSRRQALSKRQRADGFVDSSKIDFSDDDELATTEPLKRRTTRSRGLLSAPKLQQRGRSARTHVTLAMSSRSMSSSPDTSSETAQSHQDGRKTARAGLARATRSMTISRVNYKDTDEDESDAEESSDNFPTLRKRKRVSSSMTQGTRKTRIVFRGLHSQETSPAAEGTRRSARAGRSLRNMRELTENDIPEGLASKSGMKAMGAKESFKKLPGNSDFRLRHCHMCDSCYDYGDSEEKGQLIYCQGCTLSYHVQCLGPRGARDHLVTKVEDRSFVLQCRRCIGVAKKKDSMAPDQGCCQICWESGNACSPFRDRKSSKQEQKDREENGGNDPVTQVVSGLTNGTDNVLFRCVKCYRAFHMHHLPRKAEEMSVNGNAQDLAAQRFSEYCKDWLCKECGSAPADIDALIAWRPVNEDTYISGNSAELVNEDDKEYLVKWKGLSYFRTLWMPGAWVWGVTTAAMRKAFTRRDNGTNLPRMRTEDAVPEEYLRVDIVLDVRYTNVVNIHEEKIDQARIKAVEKALVKFKGLGYEDVVWEEPPEPDDGERWTDFASAYNDWVSGRYIQIPNQHNLKKHLDKVRTQAFETQVALKAQPESLSGGQLMAYQMEGVNWLYYQWYKAQNAILADEMGLGKTIQIIGFLAAAKQVHKCWPFLVVVPNSTCANWRREIKQWAPSLRVVTYFGSSEARKLTYKYELFPDNAKDLRCHVVVTSYDTAQDDSCQRFFRKVPWQGLIVDEGQRLKNDESILYAALGALKVPFKILLTGTPLQNNPRELFNLLQFLDDSINAQAMEEEYATLTKENVPQLHELLRPFFLRRTKAQVLTFLPPMAQIIVPVTLSVVQKKLYKSILAKNPDLIKAIFGGEQKALKQADRYNLNNILMQLRKCLCHPFVYSNAIEERTVNMAVSHRNLVEASSKLQLLELMLPKLQERGHRVLIFSQFLNMLDIVEDFLAGLGLLYQRLDGSIGSLQKQKRIDEFNAPESPLFAFLLSTRAGGVGINLATADTVIILDPDFNPHQDIQALSRAHRIGQEKKVLIFQLMARATAEEKIMQIGKKKMALDHVLIEQMDADDDAGMDLESILRHGAEALFQDDDTHDIHYDASSVEKLLDRSQIENTNAGTDKSAESQFSFARVWANEKGALEEDLQDSSESDHKAPDPNIWEKILKEREREAAQEAAARVEALGRGKRKRQTIDYTKQGMRSIEFDSPLKLAAQSDSDTDFQTRGAESDGEDSADGDGGEHVSPQKLPSAEVLPSRGMVGPQGSPHSEKVQKFQRAKRAKLPAPVPYRVPTPQAVARTPMGESNQKDTQASCLACEGLHPKGQCPLRIAGVEHCGLCGLAHFGHKRTCPYLNSELQCRTMLAQLKNSTEPKELVRRAQEYLRGVIGSIVKKKKEMELRKNAADGAQSGQRTPKDQVLNDHTSTQPIPDTVEG